MRIFLSAGEASGDAYAAALAERIAERSPKVQFEGVGGPRLRAQIGNLVADAARWGAISIVQSLAVAPRAYGGYQKARARLRTGTPGLFIPIDFGFFNIRLAGYAKRQGWKVLYFVPPGSWRRDRQGRDLPKIADEIVTPFPWSAEILKGMGGNVHFLGHPLKELISKAEPAAERGGIAVLPGSRTHELERNLPLIAGALGDIPEVAEFAISPSLNARQVEAEWKKLAPTRIDVFTQGDVYGVLSRAKAAVVCSGTATLEAALVRTPMVVVYQVTKAMAREAKLIGFKMPDFISLPNICLQRKVVPELVGEHVDPAAVATELKALLDGGEASERQLQGFDEIDLMLGQDDAITQTAQLAVRMLSAK